MKILITGGRGFIGGYLVEELLQEEFEVISLDNLSKYGDISRGYDKNPHFQSIIGDAKDSALLKELLSDCDHFIAGAAMIGGISYFHEFPYDIIAENERITAGTFDAAIWAFQNKKLRKITVLSSSMVFENANVFPTPEGHERICPPPTSSYGFQKLSTEYFARSCFQQYKLPFTIMRPFNCIGIGERKPLLSGGSNSKNLKLSLNHVIPDLVEKIFDGQDPLHILGSGDQIRHYTHGSDIAKAVFLSLDHPKAFNEDFNVSTSNAISVLGLAKMIWSKIHFHKPFHYVSDPAYEYDVQKRIPSTEKIREFLGFKTHRELDEALDEIIDWIKEQRKNESQQRSS